jgi:nucleotide-binding universal stress UspA family protein
VSSKSEKNTRGQQSDQTRFKRIIVAVDGSDNSMRAAKVAVVMAQRFESELTALHVIPTAHYAVSLTTGGVAPSGVFEKSNEYERSMGERVVAGVVDLAKSAKVEVRTEVQEPVGSIVEGITDYARGEHADLIVIGTRGLGGFKKLVIGSVSSGIVSHAHCSVLVVR